MNMAARPGSEPMPVIARKTLQLALKRLDFCIQCKIFFPMHAGNPDKDVYETFRRYEPRLRAC